MSDRDPVAVEEIAVEGSKELAEAVKLKVGWWGGYDKEAKEWIAACPSLNLLADGETEQDLLDCMVENTEILLTSLVNSRELEEFLAEYGWELNRTAHEDRVSVAPPSVSPPIFPNELTNSRQIPVFA